MERMFKSALCLMLCAFILTALTVGAFADGSVSYDGTAREFIFKPGSDYSPSDLFTSFKDVMPGDTLTQNITIKNDVENDVKIKLYMRSLGAHEDSEDFLSKLSLSVSYAGSDEAEYLFDAPANETAQLTDWVYLGTVYSGGEIELALELNVPLELGNDYQEAIGKLDWQFKVEELPTEPSDPLPPPTGDNSHVALYVTVLVVCVLLLGFTFVIAGKKKSVKSSEK